MHPVFLTAFGQLRQRRLDSFLVVLLVSIAVALSITSFVVLDTVLLKALPYRDADRIVHLWSVAERWGIQEYPFSFENYLDYQRDSTSFAGIGASRTDSFTVRADRPRSVPGARVSPNFLEVLGVELQIGSDFRPGPTLGSHEREDVVLIGHDLWQQELAGDPEVVGRTLLLDSVAHTIIGVLPRDLRYPTSDVQLLVPFVPHGLEKNRAFHFLRLIARLSDGVEAETAEAEIQSIAARIAAEYPDASNLDARLLPLKDQLVGGSRRSLEGIYAAVQLLFLIACGNVAGVLLVSGAARERELEVRLALGSTRAGLVRHLLIENLALTMVGGAIGFAAAWSAVQWLSHIDSALLPRAHELRVGGSTALYALAVTLFTVILSGVFPALLAARRSGLHKARGTSRAGVLRAQRSLVGGQVAFTLLLLFGGALLGRSVLLLGDVDPGFATEGAVSAKVALPSSDYPSQSAQSRYTQRAIAELEQLPGAQAVGAISRAPFSPGNASLTAFRPDQEGETDLANANYRTISPGLFESLGVELIEGREFRWDDRQRHMDEMKDEMEDDASDEAHSVVIIDSDLAELLWPDRPALGQTMRLGANAETWEVVGIVPPILLLGLDVESGYSVYVPIEQNTFLAAFATPTFVLRSEAPAQTLVEPMMTTLQAVDPTQAVLDVRPLSTAVAEWLGNRQTVALLVRVVAILALILAAIGLYATLSFTVRQQRSDLAVKAALGAEPTRLLRSSLTGGLRPAFVGLVLGILGCMALGRWLGSQLFGIEYLGVRTLVLTAILMQASALIAALPPSLRAAREDPAQVLRRSL